MKIQSSHLILDTCCILNFYASGYFFEILKSIPVPIMISEVVKERELITLEKLSDENNFDIALSKKLFSLTDFDSEFEEEAFINYAFELGDDGESATFAIAINRGWSVGTDDKKAITFFQKECPQIQVISTLEIIKYWSDTNQVDTTDLSIALLNVRNKGRYVPHKNHPLLNWWNDSIKR